MLRIFKNFRKQEVVLALFSVVFVVAQVWLELKLPDYMREITSLITTQDSAMHDILIAGGKMLLCAFGRLRLPASQQALPSSLRHADELQHSLESSIPPMYLSVGTE